MILSQVFQG